MDLSAWLAGPAEATLGSWFGPAGTLRDPLVFVTLCLLLDMLLGDPPYKLHPIRVMGLALAKGESALRAAGLDGRFGGFMLFVWLMGVFGGAAWGVSAGLQQLGHALGLPAFGGLLQWLWWVYLGYSLLALGDLIHHGRRIARAVDRQDLAAARAAAAMLVGRDVDRMDFAACNRAAVESLAESLCDGVIAPLFWFVLLGLPGLVVFKIASTMDSTVGYRVQRYLQFGWFGARLDDLLNWLPARLCVALIVVFAAIVPGYSGRVALAVARQQHSLLPGPNKGWSETAAAGALRIRLAGPIWKHGALVNELWIGRPQDPPGGASGDVRRMVILAYGATALFMAGVVGVAAAAALLHRLA